jgi:adenosylhomocysteine nucleosidase
MAFDERARSSSDEASRASGDEPITGIVAAMDEEVAGFRARIIGARPASVDGAQVTLGWLEAKRVVLVVTGDGERNARRGLAALLAAHPVSRIIVVGVAGGLSTNLDVGALVIGERVVGEADGRVHGADPALVDAAALACGGRRGVVVSAARIADTVDEKRRLLLMANAMMTAQATTAANVEGDRPAVVPAVVDLESAAFAAAATRAGIPWVVLRAVTDTAADSIPALLNRSRDDGGAVRRGSVVRRLLTNPRALLPLLALRERVRTCAGTLAHAVAMTMIALRAVDSASSPATITTAVPTAVPATDTRPTPARGNEPRVQRGLNGS